MTLLNIYNLEATGDMDVVCTFTEGEHVIGRGDTLNCNDKRVSRKHALITVAKDAVTIKSVHINPCFFKAFNGNSVTILPKETPVDLHDGDQFALLADVFWFKVKIIWQNDRNGSKSNGMKEQGSHSELDEKRVEGSPGTLRFENDASNIPSSSKRGLDEEAVVNTKRTKILPDNGNDALPSDAVIVGITENPQQVNVDFQGVNINPSKLINNLRNILEEDYGSKSEEKPKALKKENQEPDSSKEKSNLVTACNSNEVKVENTSKEKSNSATACNSNEVKVENTSKEKSNSVTACNSNEVKVENTLDKEIKVKKEKVDSEETHKESEDTPSGSNSIENVDKIKEEQREDDSTKDKKDDATGTTQNDPSCSRDNEDKKKSRRERCWYGPSCYRKNPIHRQDFSHPGDNDYDSDPDDDRPVCPFGGACYRRNLEHRRQLKHPNPPAVKPNDGDGTPKKKRKSPQKKRKPNDSSQDDPNDDDDEEDDDGTNGRKRRAAAKKTSYKDETPDDDYDYNDPFIDDASSDAFELSNDEDSEESDWEDSQEVDEESQERRRLIKEAKRFTKGKGKKKGT